MIKYEDDYGDDELMIGWWLDDCMACKYLTMQIVDE